MIQFGVAGYPPAFFTSPFRKERMKIFEWLHQLGLEAYEAQLTYGPRTPPQNCRLIRSLAEEYAIRVSVHAAYYIVFTSKDPVKVRRSVEMLKRTFELAELMGATIVVLHPGSYYGQPSAVIEDVFLENLQLFFREWGKSFVGLFLETAGKKGQFGSVEEILSVVRQTEGCFPCIDFGHVHARTGGGLKSPAGIEALFKQLEHSGAFSETEKIHFHYTPIQYGPKGEIAHKTVDEVTEEGLWHPRYEAIVEHLHRYQLPVTVISETHNSQERGALEMKKYYQSYVQG